MLRIFKACILTVFLETGLFYLLGYRKKDDVTIVVCANVITNLVLNLTIALLFPGGPGSLLVLMEIAVVIIALVFLIKSLKRRKARQEAPMMGAAIDAAEPGKKEAEE